VPLDGPGCSSAARAPDRDALTLRDARGLILRAYGVGSLCRLR